MFMKTLLGAEGLPAWYGRTNHHQSELDWKRWDLVENYLAGKVDVVYKENRWRVVAELLLPGSKFGFRGVAPTHEFALEKLLGDIDHWKHNLDPETLRLMRGY